MYWFFVLFYALIVLVRLAIGFFYFIVSARETDTVAKPYYCNNYDGTRCLLLDAPFIVRKECAMEIIVFSLLFFRWEGGGVSRF